MNKTEQVGGTVVPGTSQAWGKHQPSLLPPPSSPAWWTDLQPAFYRCATWAQRGSGPTQGHTASTGHARTGSCSDSHTGALSLPLQEPPPPQPYSGLRGWGRRLRPLTARVHTHTVSATGSPPPPSSQGLEGETNVSPGFADQQHKTHVCFHYSPCPSKKNQEGRGDQLS